MKDKEMIEEIQKALPHIEVIKAMYNDIDFAKYLYDRDIRVIPKDSVVLSKEELEKIKTNNFSYGVEKGYKSGILDGRKETAENILNDMYNEILSIEKIHKDKQSKIYSFNDTDGSIVYKMSVDLNLQFCEYAKGFIQRHAKQLGVEIKE